MNSATIICESNGHLRANYYTGRSSDFYDLIEYILEGDSWPKLITSSNAQTSKLYACGNFYCTRQEQGNLYITDIHQLDIKDYDEVQPIIVNKNSVYNLAFIFNFMRYHKVTEFTVTEEGQRYTVTASGIEPIIIDPDLGTLYNEMIPLMKVRVSNGLLQSFINIRYHRLYHGPTTDELHTFCQVFIDNLSRQDATIRYAQIKDWIKQNNNRVVVPTLVYNDIQITWQQGYFFMAPIKQDDPNLTKAAVTIYSVLKFLEAWESHLQFCDSFTLVFLGYALRFFEGEPHRA